MSLVLRGPRHVIGKLSLASAETHEEGLQESRYSVCVPNVWSAKSVIQTLRGSFSVVSKPIFASTRWKTLDDIYQITSFCASPIAIFLHMVVYDFQVFCKKLIVNMCKASQQFPIFKICTNFAALYAYLDECFSNFHRFSRKCRITLRFPEILPIFTTKSEFSG